jgi:mRNA interferase MazF
MTRFEAGDVVWVPFPHVEDNRLRPRPALVVASNIGPDGMLLWAAMITNAEREGWPGDVAIADHTALSLPIPSKVRTAKIATLQAGDATLLGKLPDATFDAVKAQINGYLDQ